MLKNKYRFVGDDMEIVMKRRNGTEVITVIDRADFPLMWIYFGSWYALWSSQTKSFYARGHINSRPISLHQYIMDTRPGEIVDHRDRDSLNNRRSNLRKASIHLNAFNQSFRSGRSRSGLRGVQWDAQFGKWRAEVCAEAYRIYLGQYDDKFEAYKITERVRREIEPMLEAGTPLDVRDIRRRYGKLRVWCLEQTEPRKVRRIGNARVSADE